MRAFAGWDFSEEDLSRLDFARHGYERGVPMGGELSRAPSGAVPRFMIMAARGPNDHNLDTPAVYYLRVLQIPTVRHSQLDAIALGIDTPYEGPAVIQERAYSSPF